MIRLDLDYIDSWSPWLDLSILLRTVTAVFGSHGAY
jgi:lipopolysaccharide/colanic/teichoic acid biosynthesis glycosyltransferase